MLRLVLCSCGGYTFLIKILLRRALCSCGGPTFSHHVRALHGCWLCSDVKLAIWIDLVSHFDKLSSLRLLNSTLKRLFLSKKSSRSILRLRIFPTSSRSHERGIPDYSLCTLFGQSWWRKKTLLWHFIRRENCYLVCTSSLSLIWSLFEFMLPDCWDHKNMSDGQDWALCESGIEKGGFSEVFRLRNLLFLRIYVEMRLVSLLLLFDRLTGRIIDLAVYLTCYLVEHYKLMHKFR